MINFGVGLVLGGAVGLCIAGIFHAEENEEQDSEWLHEYCRLEKRVKDAIHHATVIRDSAGYQHIAIVKFADEMIGILQGDK